MVVGEFREGGVGRERDADDASVITAVGDGSEVSAGRRAEGADSEGEAGMVGFCRLDLTPGGADDEVFEAKTSEDRFGAGPDCLTERKKKGGAGGARRGSDAGVIREERKCHRLGGGGDNDGEIADREGDGDAFDSDGVTAGEK